MSDPSTETEEVIRGGVVSLRGGVAPLRGGVASLGGGVASLLLCRCRGSGCQTEQHQTSREDVRLRADCVKYIFLTFSALFDIVGEREDCRERGAWETRRKQPGAVSNPEPVS